MRLIDADKLIESKCENDPVIFELENAPTVENAVVVVRCKDCVSYGIHSISGHPLSYDCYTNMPDDFCSRGRKLQE